MTRDEATGVVQAIYANTPYVRDPDWPAARPTVAYPRRVAPIIVDAQAWAEYACSTAKGVADNADAISKTWAPPTKRTANAANTPNNLKPAGPSCCSFAGAAGAHRLDQAEAPDAADGRHNNRPYADDKLNQVFGEGEGGLIVAELIWGYVPDGHRDLVFNTRVESAARMPLWADSVKYRRAVVPAWAFFERGCDAAVSPKTGREIKQLYRFWLPDEQACLLAGIWERDRFSVLTQAPNAIVGRVHNRMPVLLDAHGALEWMRFGLCALADAGIPGIPPAGSSAPPSPSQTCSFALADSLMCEPMYAPLASESSRQATLF